MVRLGDGSAVRRKALEGIPQGIRVDVLTSIKGAIEAELESLRGERAMRVEAIRRVGKAIKAFEAMGREVDKDIAESKPAPAPRGQPMPREGVFFTSEGESKAPLSPTPCMCSFRCEMEALLRRY